MIKTRLISGASLFGATGLAAYFLPACGVWLVIVALSCLAGLEFYAMMLAAGFGSFRVLGLSAGAALISATFLSLVNGSAEWVVSGADAEILVLFVTILVVIVRQFPRKRDDHPIETIAVTLLGVLYVPFLFNYFTKLIFGWEEGGFTATIGLTGRLLTLYLIVVVKSMDAGAYFVGTAFGKHKLLPRISPRKTWEGLFGGIAAALVASVIFFRLLPNSETGGMAAMGLLEMNLTDAIVLGVLLAVAGVFGDLAESLIKRASGMKDSGQSIPGMGGLLDILDSLLFGAPVLYYYARFFLQ